MPTPSTPILDSLNAASGEITASYTTALPGDLVYVMYKLARDTNWILDPQAGTGSGSRTLTGLINFAKYNALCFVDDGDYISLASNMLSATPTDGSLPLHKRLQLSIAGLIDAQGYTTFDDVPYDIVTTWPPRWEDRPIPTIFVIPDSFDGEPGTTNTITRELGISIGLFEATAEDDEQMTGRLQLIQDLQLLLAANTTPTPESKLLQDAFTESRVFNAGDLQKYNFLTPFTVNYKARCNR